MSSPYAGNPSNYPVSVTIPSDSDIPDTANLMTPVEGALDRTANLNMRALSMAALNWGQAYTITTYNKPTAACWDGLNSRWLVGAIDGSNSGVLYGNGIDGAGSWTQIGTDFTHSSATRFVSDICKDPLNTAPVIAAVIEVGSSGDIMRWDGSSWTNVHAMVGGGSNSSARLQVFQWRAGMVQLTRFLCFEGSGTVADCGVAVSADGITWTDTLFGATTHFVDEWRVAVSTDKVIAVPVQDITGLDQALLVGSTSGLSLTFAVVSIASSLAAGDAPCAIAYGTQLDSGTLTLDNIFLLAVQPSGGGTKFLSSTDDGVTWTVVSTITSQKVVDVTAMGSLFVATCEAASGGPDYSIFSIDGGVTWHLTPASFLSNAGGSPDYYTKPRVVSNGLGFCMLNTLNQRFSLQVGLSPSVS